MNVEATWWENIRLLMRSLWDQEIHYETRSRGCFQHCSHFLPVSSFKLQHKASNAIREIGKALNRMQVNDGGDAGSLNNELWILSSLFLETREPPMMLLCDDGYPEYLPP